MTKFISYKGWKVWSLENRWIKLYIAPHLGGRIIQLIFMMRTIFIWKK